MPLDNALMPEEVGVLLLYTGTKGIAQGCLDKYNGKWVYLTLDGFRTIGNASSSAAIAAAWTETLFTHLWNQYTQTRCSVLTAAGGVSTRGATAAADYAANKRMTLPDERGRVFAGAGTGAGLTARSLHTQMGEENHVQTIGELVPHQHAMTAFKFTAGGANTVRILVDGTGSGITQLSDVAGGGTGMNVIQPTTFEHFLIAAGSR